MKRFALMALASGLAIAAAAPANATIYIAYSTNGGTTTTQLATDAATPGSAGFVGTIGALFFNVGATGFPITTQPDLLTQSINVGQVDPAARTNTLTIFITQTGLNSFNGNLLSSFTSNVFSGSAQSATISSYYSAANALYTGTQLKTSTFTGLGTSASSNAVAATGPFSTTVRYDLTFGAGTGSFNDTANLSAVPEPATWAMMIMGFGLIGGALRSRKTKTTVAFA